MRQTASIALLLIILATGATIADESTPRMISESKLELFTSDPDRSAAFYSILGFAVVHRKPSGYTTLRQGSTVIALSPVPWWLPVGWLGFLRYPPIGTEIVLYTTQLEHSRTALSKAGYSPGEIVLQTWGDRDFRITDADGYYIRVSEGVAIHAVESSAAPRNDERGQ
jgi:catechol 2,3-dioxygenase-like lactoylglutathione lyase family enzyme